MAKTIDSLIEVLQPLQSIAVAFSGGVDSSVVVAASLEALGKENVLAVTARSETLPAQELVMALEFTSSLDVSHSIVDTQEMDCEDFAANTPDRCFYCKRELWKKVRQVADEKGIRHMADGVNADDLGDHRPGIRASDEAGVVHPLAQIGAGKEDVRELARELGLANWEKPAQACLSSRFAYGQRITREGLRRVEQAEEFLQDLNLEPLRVRDHGDMARIEVSEEALDGLTLADLREGILSRFKELGYVYVTLDLEGFRTGSMNEILTNLPQAE
ncbi:MAG: ATP-dependent sacrificial sulfur transferase LarE [Thermoleophilia bacterium]